MRKMLMRRQTLFSFVPPAEAWILGRELVGDKNNSGFVDETEMVKENLAAFAQKDHGRHEDIGVHTISYQQ
jgi:hypothetical protein